MKKAVMLIWILCLACSVMGCGRFENTEIVFTTGLSDEELFKVGDSLCTLPEAMVYVDAYAERYESVYGVEMWTHDFGGVTLEEYVKNNIVSQLATIKAMTLLAEAYNVVLDKVDEEQVELAAKAYLQSLTEAEKECIRIDEKDVKRLYRDHLLATRVYEEITRNVDTEVSDDEARVISVQQILLKAAGEEQQEAYEKAQEIREKALEGSEFLSLASIYSDDPQITYTFGRGEMDPVYEEVAFALEKEEISEIFFMTDGYYILKCTENFDRDATDANKENMIEKRRDRVFRQVYEELIANTPSEFHAKIWEGVSMENPSLTHTGVTFFSIYDSYFS